MTEFKVEGLAELQKMLDDLPANIEKNIMRGGLRAGAKVVQEEAQRVCPVGSGNLPKGEISGSLKNSIRISMKVRKGKVQAFVKAGDKVAFYAHMVEYGTASHLIKPRDRKSLFLAGLFKEVIKHPGATKKPFMRPALDNKAQDAIDTMADYIRERIPKEIEKLK